MGLKMRIKIFKFSITFFSILLILSSTYADDCIWVPSDLYGDNFENSLITFMEDNHINSLAFSVLNSSEIFYSKGFGEQSSTDIAYHMMSASKMFTGVAILQLQEQGLLDLDDDINTYLPYEIRNPHWPSTPITLKHLLAHRSGTLSAEDTLDTYWALLDNGTYSFPEITYEFLNVNGSVYSEDNWYTWEPGTYYVYSDIGFDILTIIISIVTGQSYFDYVEENIFIPLEMYDTHHSHEDYLPENVAIPYNWNLTTQTNDVVAYFNCSNNPGGGGYFSTVNDMAKFMLAQMNQGEYNGISILTPTSIELMHTEIEYSKWALGWRTRQIFGSYRNFQGHGGGPWLGFAALNYMREDLDLGIVLLLNQGVNPGREYIFAQIFEKAIKIRTDKCTPTTPTPDDTNFYLLPIVSMLIIFSIVHLFRKKKVKH